MIAVGFSIPEGGAGDVEMATMNLPGQLDFWDEASAPQKDRLSNHEWKAILAALNSTRFASKDLLRKVKIRAYPQPRK